MPEVITNNLDLWSSALRTKSTAGRGSNGKQEAYGIKKLRELILELAVRGKLVPQDPNDEPANVLLEKIAKEKSRLIRKGEIKKEKSLPDIGDDEKQLGLPHGWEWSRLQDVSSYIQRGKGPEYADYGKVRVVSQKCVQWSGFDLTQARYVDDASLDSYQPERFLKKNDLLWNSTGTGTVGRINVVPAVPANSLVADSHVTIIRPLLVNSNFLRCYIAAPGIQQRIEPVHGNPLVSGTTNQVELNTGAVTTLVVPVPPLIEQDRIVAKVDELMALCDQLEQQQTHSIAAHQTLVETVVAALIRPTAMDDVQDAQVSREAGVPRATGGSEENAGAILFTHFDTLFITEHSIDQLKQTILQLAVMGKLVPQDKNEEPALALLDRIATHKAEMSKNVKLRGPASATPIDPEEGDFQLPPTWVWVRFGEIMVNRDGERIPVSKEERAEKAKVYDYYGASGVIDKIDGYLFDKPLLLIGEDGANLINRSTPIAFIARGQYWVNNHAHVLDGISEGFLRYIELHINATNLERYVTGSAQPKMNQAKMNTIPIALPPLGEQARIVAKVDELMALCDALKARLADAQTVQTHLADAIVEQAVA